MGQAQHAGQYLSAASYWHNHNSFVRSVGKTPGNIKRGQIMSYNYDGHTFHLEVITSGAVGEKTWFGLTEDEHLTTFRSRGGGRGAGRDGVEKQGERERTLRNSRLKVLSLYSSRSKMRKSAGRCRDAKGRVSTPIFAFLFVTSIIH